MNDRFKQVLEEASKRVSEWPEWKKSEALKLSERSLESKQGTATGDKQDSKRANSAATGK
jgi:hypothetical protein